MVLTVEFVTDVLGRNRSTFLSQVYPICSPTCMLLCGIPHWRMASLRSDPTHDDMIPFITSPLNPPLAQPTIDTDAATAAANVLAFIGQTPWGKA